jgi:beta-glucosidase
MKTSFTLLILFASFSVSKAQQLPVYLDESKALEERVEDALSRMTLKEKVAMCHAQSKFSSAGVPRLGIPENWMTDGPHGIRPEVLWDEWDQAGWTNDSCIAFPALTCLAATWNEELSLLYGKSIGEEARYRNKNVLLGPGVNIYRTPLNGRNFEYMGEDPYLASRMVVPYIKGVQSNGVAACVKHFALNNQEVDRHTVNVDVDDRALYEIYLPAFKAAVQEGQAWAIMGAYNKYKGLHCCHNQYLLNNILRDEWKFDGVVVSDWGGVYDTRQAAYNGLDMEFGTGTNGLTEGVINAYDNYFLANPFLRLLQSGEINEEIVNAKVRNILRLVFRTTMNTKRSWGSFGTPEHAAAGRKIAEEGIVLLQNKNNLLPIDFSKVKRILVVGENAIKTMTVGGGSSSLKAKYEISPLNGIKERIDLQAEVVYARGYVGDPSNSYNKVTTGQDLTETRSTEELIMEAQTLAKDADLVIFIGGLNKSNYQDSEGNDRKCFELPYEQDRIITELLNVNKNLVVINISGNAVAMPWVNDVPAIVQSWYNGTESGTALASVLTGDVNPSGKLPFTFPVKLEDNPAMAYGNISYPGIDKEQTYKESIFVGYRWTEKEKIKPLFPFGHGLSYTVFEYGKVTANKKEISGNESITVTVSVKNTGYRDGAEVVQLYISDLKSSLPRPVKELKGFKKVYLKAGEEKDVSFTINKSSLSFFDDKKHDWVTESGEFKMLVGTSSTDIRSICHFILK